ncbi:ATP-dependent RNA helicase vasa [Anopheles funestus]|uniref:RNA helicase n=1 Tax=Anopheles funestus TaxID=62324 RepID=A0A182RK99_ANOFN|nr:ATP-dependent RNA helicase vasa [Anopheles funestus]XP_049286818.1 ATP-dependent RNA helicase vasa [Anopheles funestus]
MSDDWEECDEGRSFDQPNFNDVSESVAGENTNNGFDGYEANNGFDDDNNGGFQSYENGGEDDYGSRRGGRGGRGGGRGRGRGRGGRDGGFGGERNGNYRDRNGDSRPPYSGNDPSMDEVKSDKPKSLYIPPLPTEDESLIFGSGISSGINFEKFDDIEVRVSGENPPNPVDNFEQSGLREEVMTNVRKSKYTKPTPIQRYAIPIIQNGRDLMACAQTGSGKTAAFMLPMIHNLLDMEDALELRTRNPYIVIVAPTRELAIQIHEEGRKFAHGTKLKVCVSYGGTAVHHQLQLMRGGCHILVGTPGRLLDFIDREHLTLENVKFMVLDEADRMLDMGFLPSIEKVMGHATMPNKQNRQTLMFSATFPSEIQELAGKFLNNYICVFVGIVGGACADVEQTVHLVEKFKKRKKLEEILNESNPKGTLVFVETKRNADYLASLMSETQFPTTSIHGDRMQREREMALDDFKNGRMDVLIATSVAARGLDIKNVSHVINYDLPKSIDDYVHRIGRTGRVGNKGRATSFYEPEADRAMASDLVKILTQAGQSVPDFLKDAGGASTYMGASQFGGKDIRDSHGSRVDAQPAALEPEEAWD